MIGSLYTNIDVENTLRGLAVAAAAMPVGQFRDGYETALMAVGVTFGMEFPQNSEPQRSPTPVVRADWDGVDSGVFATWAGGS